MWKACMPFVKWYMRQVYSYADVCLAISPRVEEAIKETGAKTTIVRISNPIPTEIWKRTKEKREEGRKLLGLNDTDFVVLGVGHVAITSITPKYWSMLTTRLMGMIIFSNHNVVFLALGKAVSTEDLIRCELVVDKISI